MMQPQHPQQLPACMGGLCLQRDHCLRHLTDNRQHVVERLCARGQETPEPVMLRGRGRASEKQMEEAA